VGGNELASVIRPKRSTINGCTVEDASCNGEESRDNLKRRLSDFAHVRRRTLFGKDTAMPHPEMH
jgi:hypothetical protein